MDSTQQYDAVLHGRRILIVEDEMLVAMEIESLLESHGCRVLGPAPSVRKACALLDAERPDAALLDLNLGGQPATAVAAALRAQDVPFVVVSGYGGAQLQAPEIDHAVRVEKPFNHRALLRALAQVLDYGREAGRPTDG